MVDIHFIHDPTVLTVIQTILDSAGPNFQVPFDTSVQPPNGASLNADALLQFQLPAGASLQGYAEPATLKSIGAAINSLMGCLAPLVSAYMLILPILGVIRGILEVLCALMNPFSVYSAVRRLFRKWLPPLMALMPPFAGVIFILNLIKIILSIVFYILTVIVPTIELIKYNIEILGAAFGVDGNAQKQAAGKNKLLAILADILNQIGLFSVIQPILDLVYAILKMSGGRPCHRRKKLGPGETEDETCCDDNVCPPVLSNMPTGTGLLYMSPYSDAPVGFAWKLLTLTGNSLLSDIIPMMQNMSAQLNAQIDTPISEAVPAGQTGDSANFDVQISGRRGNANSISVPLVDVDGNTLTLINGGLNGLGGVVNYTIVPNWEMLTARNIVGLGCTPDIASDISDFGNTYSNAEDPALVAHPELDITGAQATVKNSLDGYINDISSIVNSVAASSSVPPYDAYISALTNVENNIVGLLSNYVNYLKDVMNTTLSNIADPLQSTLAVDKNVVKADNIDKATISITVMDTANNLIAKNLPTGVGINVKIFTTFGNLINQLTDSSTGITTAELISPYPGTANITAMVNSQYIVENINGVNTTTQLQVLFVGDAVLPARRVISKQRLDVSPSSTMNGTDRQPGGNHG